MMTSSWKRRGHFGSVSEDHETSQQVSRGALWSNKEDALPFHTLEVASFAAGQGPSHIVEAEADVLLDAALAPSPGRGDATRL